MFLGAIARRIAENRRPKHVDRVPYDHAPLCGLVIGDVPDGAQPGYPFHSVPCSRSEVNVFAESDGTATFLLSFLFTWDESTSLRATRGRSRLEDATLLFPISEFGRVVDFSVRLNGSQTSLRGDIVRRVEADLTDDVLVPVKRGEAKERNERRRVQAEEEKKQRREAADTATSGLGLHGAMAAEAEHIVNDKRRNKAELPADLCYYRAPRIAAQFVIQRKQQEQLDREREEDEAAKKL